jgi:hypothetical protein
MTPENKKVVKIIALSVGIILVLTVITVLIVKQIQKGRDEEASRISDGGDSAPSKPSSGYSGGGSSTSSFGGRTFSKEEIEKMQSYLFNMGAMAMNDTIVSAIRDTGGIDGKIGTGFKTAYNEAIRIGIIHSLNELYSEAMKHS